jgi:hypothetical protein
VVETGHLMNTKTQFQIVGPPTNDGFRMVIPENSDCGIATSPRIEYD